MVLSKTFSRLLSRFRKQILIAFDILVISLAYIAPWVIINGRADYQRYSSLLVASWFLFVSCFEIVYALMGVYDSLWRYAEIVEFFRLCVASIIAVALFGVTSFFIFKETRVPISVYFLSALFAVALTLYSRLTYRMYRNVKLGRQGKRLARRTLLIGAGDAASTLLHEQYKAANPDMNIICCVDDAPEKQGRYIMGVQIMGTTEDIPELVERCEIETILLAIPTMDEENRRRVLSICNRTKCNVKILPDIVKMITDGEDLASRIRDVKVEDLLGRDEVQLSSLITQLVGGKRIMVTGGGGSIGSELCRQIASCKPAMLIIVDIYENNAYAIQQELRRKYGDELNLEVLIASVRDSKKMDALFSRLRPQVIFHAAAHKHVPLMEDSPNEAIKNNVFGTYNMAQSAAAHGVKRFVLISTDKAVNPTNIMGASKRLCEMVVQMMDRRSDTEFVAVRFGNVLGSNGSVVPLFERQIACGGPVTVTHPEITRFFMTIPKAVSLVLQAGYYARGGEIFVLDMGQPVKIDDMARQLIRLSGFEPDVDIPIIYTGLRPGEKLYEELLMDEEGLQDTANRLIHVGRPIDMDDEAFCRQLEVLERACRHNSPDIRRCVADMVPTYHPKKD